MGRCEKGDEEHLDYRSRLVAKEIKKGKREGLFAATPPLEALKILMSLALTEGVGYVKGREEEGMQIEFIDSKRASVQAPARRGLYVQLPAEEAGLGKCAELLNVMYGARDMAQNWDAGLCMHHADAS